MWYIPKIGEYFINLDLWWSESLFNFDEYLKSSREKLYSKLIKKQTLRNIAESLYMFLTSPDEVEKHVEMMQSSYSDNGICHFNIKLLNISTQSCN